MHMNNFTRNAVTNILATNISDIYKKIEKYQVVSFDLFDTLLTRLVPSSTDVITYFSGDASRICGISENTFIQRRLEYERKAVHDKFPLDVTLADIYAHFITLSDKQRNDLMDLECAAELKLSKPNKRIVELFNYCKKIKKVIIVSDTPLRREFIECLLKKNNIEGYAELYVSSDKGLSKYSGTLYDYVLGREKVARDKLLHIGDSFHSDYLNARKKGINSLLIKSLEKKCILVNTRYRKSAEVSLGNKILKQFIYINENNQYNQYQKLGYEILGPLLCTFSSWLYNNTKDFDKLVFLAREGVLINKAFSFLYPEEESRCGVLRVSRRSVRGCTLSDVYELDDLFNELKTFSETSLTLNELVNLGYVSKSTAESFCKNNNIKLNFDILKATNGFGDNVGLRFKNEIIPAIREHSSNQLSLLSQYFKSVTSERKNICVVDVGWRGSMQDSLSELFSDIFENPIEGFYFGVSKDSRITNHSIAYKHGALFEDDNKTSDYSVSITLTGQIFELLFMDTENGTTLSYEIDQDNNIVPVIGESEYSGASAVVLKEIQNAAFDFIRDYKMSDLWLEDNSLVSCADAFQQYMDLFNNASNKTINMFKMFSTNDVEQTALISQHALPFWIFHPQKFNKEFKDNHSKSLFLKSVFMIPFPYYDLLKKILLKNEKERN